MNIESNAQVVKPSPEEIAAAAYYIWEKEGRIHGRDAEHWQKAEAQLMANRTCGKAEGCEPPPPQNIACAVAQSLREVKQPPKKAARNGRRQIAKLAA